MRKYAQSIFADIEKRYLRTVKRDSELSVMWMERVGIGGGSRTRRQIEISRLLWTQDGRGALEVRGTAMQLLGYADDEILEGNAWSWWPAAARRQLESLRDPS
ncbi:hypothetical protein DFH09DRAFT_1287561 [Mycena vulgaris]|nr:hypothetical protein DFH09DRAFT_1287561 [Mycena vulgaris]